LHKPSRRSPPSSRPPHRRPSRRRTASRHRSRPTSFVRPISPGAITITLRWSPPDRGSGSKSRLRANGPSLSSRQRYFGVHRGRRRSRRHSFCPFSPLPRSSHWSLQIDGSNILDVFPHRGRSPLQK